MNPLPRLLVLAFGILFSLAARGENLVPNGDLSTITWQQGGLPAGVAFSADPAPKGLETKASVAGVAPGIYALCIERLYARGNSRFHFQPEIPVHPGQRYYFSCNVKATGGAPGIIFSLADSAGKGVAHASPEDAVSTNPDVRIHENQIDLPQCLMDKPDGFNTLDLTFTIPSGISFLSIELNFGWIVGTAWFEHIRLLPLDQADAPKS